MPNYTTLLKTWGDTGTEYPTGYSYIEGEQPVDAWDNFLIHNVVKDLQGLIDTTNDDLVQREGGSLLSDLAVGSHGLVGDAGSVDFGGTEITADGVLDVLDSMEVSGNIAVTGTVDGVDVALLKSNFDDVDSTYINIGDPVPHPIYATTGDVPALSAGETVVVGGDLYLENGN